MSCIFFSSIDAFNLLVLDFPGRNLHTIEESVMEPEREGEIDPDDLVDPIIIRSQ